MSRLSEEVFKIEAEAIAETNAALLVKTELGEEWIPKSVIHDDSEVYKKGHEGEFIIMEWFAKQKKWV